MQPEKFKPIANKSSVQNIISIENRSVTDDTSRKLNKQKQTFKAEKTRGGIVKGSRFGPPVMMCFLTVDIICINRLVMDDIASFK